MSASARPIAAERSIATVEDCREALRLIYGLLADFDRKLTMVVDAIVDIRDEARQRDAKLALLTEKLLEK